MNISKIYAFSALIISLLIYTSCSKDEESTERMDNGQVTFEITDAPIDNANVQGAFVTISDIKVDGQSWSGFNGKQTIDLLAYQNGNTKSLGMGNLNVASYNQVELILDYAQDVDGNTPGCFVLTTDNTKANLNSGSASTGSIVINDSGFDVSNNSNVNIVIDFDLRKAIMKGNGAKEYTFKNSIALSNALRAENKDMTGSITGTLSSNATINTDNVVVFAYEKGTYSDAEASSDVNTQFQGAITSATVDNSGNYTLSFLEEGEYDLIYCNYKDENNDGEMELSGKLTLDIAGSLDLKTVSVSSGTKTTVDIVATGILNF